jgi:hypothetical protein
MIFRLILSLIPCLKAVEIIEICRRIIMRSWKKIIFIAFLLIATYFIVDIGRYFIYPNLAYLKKNRSPKTAFMQYREKVWQKKGIKRKITNIWVPLFQSISLRNESCNYRGRR